MTDIPMHSVLTPDLLRDVLQACGYRVEPVQGRDGAVSLRSATSGLAFDVHFANPPPGGEAGYSDATFQAAFRVQGELPLSLVNQWNVSRRFGRLNLVQNLLLLDMDIVALGGVATGNLRVQIEIWDRLVSQLVAFLKDELPRLPKVAPGTEPAVALASDAA